MDVEYLKKTINEPLKKALLQVSIARPNDPIDFIGEFLISYNKHRILSEQDKLQKEQEKQDLAKIHLKRKEEERLRREREEQERKAMEDIEKAKAQANVNPDTGSGQNADEASKQPTDAESNQS